MCNRHDRPPSLFWAIWLTLWSLFVYMWLSSDAEAADIESFVTYSHTSDITRGKPFHSRNGDEWTLDFLGAGFTITAGDKKRWEIDFAHGRRARNCSPRKGCPSETSSTFSVRMYPGRGRD